MFFKSRFGCALLLLFLSIFISTALATAPTSFCKCTCFSNSTIIPLNPPSSQAKPGYSYRSLFDRTDRNHKGNEKQYRAGNCNDCNRQFCLDYNLPFCKNAKEEDVFTTCFQRDSRKDEAIVFIFIIATGGLLIYAAIKPWLERVLEAARERRLYIPIADHGES